MKKKLYFILFFLLCAVLCNIALSFLEKETFNAEKLPSNLKEGKKLMTEQDKVGCLSFGPYLKRDKGVYIVKIYYRTDTSLNEYDVASMSQNKIFLRKSLKEQKKCVKQRLVLDNEVSDLEIRTYYAGKGSLYIDRIEIYPEKGKLYLVTNLILVLLFIFLLEKRKIHYEEAFVGTFFLIIFCPLFLTQLRKLTGKPIDVSLNGNFQTIEKPDFDVLDFLNSEYQNKFSKWWRENFAPRNLTIKLFNQLRYSCFNQGTRIIGKKGDIFEENYINDAFCLEETYDFSLPENREKLVKYYECLVSVQKKLEEYGKIFLFYTTPSKAIVNKQTLPAKYLMLQQTESKRAIEIFRELTKDGELNYLDASQLVYNVDCPLFYHTGIHLSRPVEQVLSNAIIERVTKGEKGIVNLMELVSLEKSKEPFWRDADVFELLNTFSPVNEKAYYVYKTQTNTTPGKGRVLTQGDSFSLGFRKDIRDNALCEGITSIFYNEYIISENDEYIPISSWNNFDFERYLSNSDIIVIESNEAILNQFGSGFAENLEFFLNTYGDRIKKTIPNESINNTVLDFRKGTINKASLMSGFYEQEAGFCWVGMESSVVLSGWSDSSHALLIEFIVPDEIKEFGGLSIYLNDELYQEVSFVNKGLISVEIPYDFQMKEENSFKVSMISSDSFCPKKIGISSDERELALQMLYIGEKK